MTWDEDSVEAAAEVVGEAGTIWILHLAGNTEVGKGKTSDFHTQCSSVRACAKELGLDDPGVPTVKEGYRNLYRRRVTDSEGRSGPILNHKKENIVALTSLGKTLVTKIDNDERAENKLKEYLDIETEEPEDDWWPHDGPDESFSVYLYTNADRSVREEDEVEIEAHARFDCPKCGESVSNVFDLVLREGTSMNWGMIEAECDNCGMKFKHSAADPHCKPTPV